METENLLTTAQAAEILGIGPQALRRRQVYGIGPKPVLRPGWGWLYRRADVEAAPHRLKPGRKAPAGGGRA